MKISRNWCRAARMLALLLGLHGAEGMAAAPMEQAAPVVGAPSGHYRGVADDSMRIFRGIRYAAPPMGPLRWRPPQEMPRSDNTQDATRFGAVCPQSISKAQAGFLNGREQSEDCLTLNIWSDGASSEPRPVMVYIHGGFYTSGSGSFDSFDGRSLARKGMVVVTFNYRIGVLGFFAHPALTRAAAPDEPLVNFALMDQIAALRWIQRNISAFGGDPRKVTIFGMSAGGQSVNYLMATPSAHDLFQRAISESSAISTFQPYRLSTPSSGYPSMMQPSGGKPAYEELGRRLAEARGIGDDPGATDRLREIPVEWLLDYQGKNLRGAFEPVLDGRLLKESVGEAFRNRREAPVPYIAGVTDWEGSLSAPFGGAFVALRLASVGMNQADARRFYGEMDDSTLTQRVDTDVFLASQRWLVSRHAQNGHPSWLYYFSYKLEAHRDQYPGAPHGAEVRYVFGTLDGLARVQDRAMGSTISPADRSMADIVSGYWVSMAREGNPNSKSSPTWPAYSPSEDVALELGTEIRMRKVCTEWSPSIDAVFDSGKF
ncbi:MAG: carboxylesterase family protein [Rhodocyclaceae bacterium]|nr:carboxylesterase family protein [Rhodocyclaceae bacterium]